jgi:hypothetical protein
VLLGCLGVFIFFRYTARLGPPKIIINQALPQSPYRDQREVPPPAMPWSNRLHLAVWKHWPWIFDDPFSHKLKTGQSKPSQES